MKRKNLFRIVMAVILSMCSLPLTTMQAQESLAAFSEEELFKKGRMEDFKELRPEVTSQEGNVKAATKAGEEYNYFEREDGTLEITGYSGNDTELIVPAEIDGKCVASIGLGAFRGCNSLTKVELSEGVTSIYGNVFNGCSSLRSIKLPSSLTYIDVYAFEDCNSDLTLLVYKGSYAETYAKNTGINYRYIDDSKDCFHTWKTDIVKATTKKHGSIMKTCTKCREQVKETIYAAKSIKLSKTSGIYNGKKQKPSVTVKNSKGKILKNKDWTVTYPKAMKNVGSYIVTIKLKGNYKGNVKKTFQIVPKGTQISRIKAKKKGFVLKWKKQAVQTTGYEIVYSANKTFAKKTAGTIVIGKNKTISKTVSKLKAGKKYYVKIRTYKTVKLNGKPKKWYSAWSKVKTVTTQK